MKTLFKNAMIHPVSSKSFQGDILIGEEKILALGSSVDVSGAEIRDCTGKHIYPGFIDAHTHLGLMEEGVGDMNQDVNEATNPDTAQVRVIDGFNPDYRQIKAALAGGITCVMVLPGSANPIGGQGAILKLKGTIVDDMIIKEPAGLKMALGENPKRVYGSANKLPSTRLGNAACIREFFTKAINYRNKKAAQEKEGKVFADLDMNMEVALKVLNKEIPARIHAHRRDDIVTAVRLAKEFNFDLVVEHASEAYKMPDFMKEQNIPVVLGPLLGVTTKPETIGKNFESFRIISEAGILGAIMTDHPVIPQELAVVHAGLGLKYGSTEESLLKMLTVNPAKILKLDERLGSLEKGKDADLVVWSSNPFSLHAVVEQSYIDGELVYQR